MNSRIEINILDLSEVTGGLLTRLLQRKQKNGRLLKKGKTYWLGLQKISLSHDIIIREKIPGIWHYDVIDDRDCGAGKFGSAHTILAVLNHHGQLHTKQRRIYKIQQNSATTEFTLMRRCPHLHARALFSGIPSFITMRKFNGMMLNDALNNERKIKPFSHSQRYKISIALLRALKRQMHDNMICHRDIKPDNIFYDPETGEIDIFDLGISQLIGDQHDLRSRGNATFSAPEEFSSVKTYRPVAMAEFRVSAPMQSLSSVQADIYSMARVIGLVWRDNDAIFFEKDIDHARLMKRRIHANWQPDFILFQNLLSIGNEEKIKIENLLRRMATVDPCHRPSLIECIAVFNNIFLEYKLSKTPVVLHDVIRSSHQLALQVQAKLDEIEDRQDLAVRVSNMMDEIRQNPEEKVSAFIGRLTGKICYEYNVLGFEIAKKYRIFGCDPDLSVREFIDYLRSTSSLQVLISYLQTALRDLPDHPRAVIEFIETLDVKVFHGILSKTDLLKKIEDINNSFICNLSTLMHLYDEMRENGDHLGAVDLNHYLSSLVEDRMTIDNVDESAKHMHRKLMKLTAPQNGVVAPPARPSH